MANNIYEFFRAAMPWIVMGLLLAGYLARSGKKKKEDSDNYAGEGMGLGMCLGLCFFTALGRNIGLGLCIGMLGGLAIGSSIRKERKDNEENGKG